MLNRPILFIKLSYTLFLLASSFVFSQSNQKVIEIESLIDSAYEKASEGDWEASATYSNKALLKSQKDNYEKGEGWSNFYLGQAFSELFKYKEALKVLKTTENLKYAKEDPFLLFEIHRVKGRVYGSLFLFKEAIQEQRKGLKILNQVNRSEEDKKYLTAIAYENLIYNFKRIEGQDSAFHYMQKEDSLLSSMDESFVFINLINLYPEIGEYYAEQGDYEKAETYFIKTLQLCEKYKYPFRARNYIKWGDMMMKQERNDEALHYYSLALEHNQNTNRTAELAQIYQSLANTYRNLGNTMKAEELTIKYLTLKNEIRDKQLNASEFVLDTIVLDKSKTLQSFYKKNLIWIVVISTMLISVLLFLVVKIKKRKRKLNLSLKKKVEIINELENKAYQEQLELLDLARTGNINFWVEFQKVHPQLKEELLKLNPKITTSELTLAAYVYLDFTTNEIANLTHRAFKTIETTRYNLRKKLQLNPDVNLNQFLTQLIQQQKP